MSQKEPNPWPPEHGAKRPPAPPKPPPSRALRECETPPSYREARGSAEACNSCRHYTLMNEGEPHRHKCMRTAQRSLIDGKPSNYRLCIDERYPEPHMRWWCFGRWVSVELCGPEGKYWEPKPVIQPPPKKP